jgi:hypothetical protein
VKSLQPFTDILSDSDDDREFNASETDEEVRPLPPNSPHFTQPPSGLNRSMSSAGMPDIVKQLASMVGKTVFVNVPMVWADDASVGAPDPDLHPVISL